MSSVVDGARATARKAAARLAQDAADTVEQQIGKFSQDAALRSKSRLDRVLATIGDLRKSSETSATLRGVDENEILSYVPDQRSLSGISWILLAVFVSVVTPQGFGWLASPLYLAGACLFLYGYVWHSKVDIGEGYSGVSCRFGEADKASSAHRGRNWIFSYRRWVPMVASLRDQVVTFTAGNFTKDFATVTMSPQLVFQVRDVQKFGSTTTPASMMAILQLYATYGCLRIVSSIPDSRVKFTGREHLGNIIEWLNGKLSETYGVEVIRLSVPTTSNGVLDDLEEVRTILTDVDASVNQRQVRVESAVKAVETELRTRGKETRRDALTLQQTSIGFSTQLTEELSAARQAILLECRRDLSRLTSELQLERQQLLARQQKAKAVRQHRASVVQDLDLRLASIRRRVMLKCIPKQVVVCGVRGVALPAVFKMINELLERTGELVGPGGSKPTAERT